VLARLSQRRNDVRAAPRLWTTGQVGFAGRAEDESGLHPSGLTERPASGTVRPAGARKLRVLVLEPAAVLRNILAHALAVQGYEVRTAERIDGLEGRVSTFDPHLVVSEATLTDGTGDQVCRLIQAHGGGKLVPVILISGMPEGELETRAKAAGADRSFCKARGLSQLLDLVEELTSEILY
jgi:CheY-like chemotaxis protein